MLLQTYSNLEYCANVLAVGTFNSALAIFEPHLKTEIVQLPSGHDSISDGAVQFALLSEPGSGKAQKRIEQPRRMAVAGKKLSIRLCALLWHTGMGSNLTCRLETKLQNISAIRYVDDHFALANNTKRFLVGSLEHLGGDFFKVFEVFMIWGDMLCAPRVV